MFLCVCVCVCTHQCSQQQVEVSAVCYLSPPAHTHTHIKQDVHHHFRKQLLKLICGYNEAQNSYFEGEEKTGFKIPELQQHEM